MDDDAIDTFEDEFDVAEEDNNSGDDAAQKGDGLADMMSKILNQKVGEKIPILAKRKTALMKEMEGSHVDSDRIKRQRAEKRAEREKQLVVPDLTSADFERQLRKLATRGGKCRVKADQTLILPCTLLFISTLIVPDLPFVLFILQQN